VLHKLPTGSDGYDWAYCEVMERVKKQPPDSYAMAIQTLAWVSCARRPLTTSELCHALAVEEGETSLDEDNIPDIEDILTVCAGLVAADKMSGTVRLVHFTTKEFFNRTWEQWFPEGPAEIASTCATYLSFDTFNGPCASDGEFENRLRENPFYEYAGRNWGYHAGDLPSGVDETGLSLLNNKEHMAAITQLLFAVPGSPGYSQRVPTDMTGLHIAAYFGLHQGTSALLKLGFSPKTVDSYGQSPLWYAAKNGHVDVVKVLLDSNEVEVDRADDLHQQTPLWWAVSNGHDEIVRLLLEKNADPNTKDKDYGRSPLLWTARFGRAGVVKLLLEKDNIEVNARDSLYQDTPLTWAAKNDHREVVALLLAHPDIDLGALDKEMGQSALCWAARRGHEEVLRLILDTEKARINAPDTVGAPDKHGATPLAWACRNGHLGVVKALLAQEGIQVDTKDSNNLTPLDCARGAGHDEIVRAIREHANGGVPSSIPDSNELSLMKLIRQADLDKATMLLTTNKVDINFRDGNGWSALLWAARYGLVDLMRLLLQQGDIEVNIHDTWGQTPLWWAARGGHAEVTKLLLSRPEINVNSTITNPVDKGETALASASRCGHSSVVRVLLDRSDIDPNAKDCWYRTPILWAAREGHDAVLKMLLLRADIDVNAQDRHGRSALAWAGRHGNEMAAHLLLTDKRVIPDLQDVYGRQPVAWAEEHGHQDVASMLRRRSSAF
jgi:ankyrin repeat protein